jgi:CMP/dCMP kinase
VSQNSPVDTADALAAPLRPFHGIVAVDGPSGVGKSTISRGLATRLRTRYVDTGAMYRALTRAVLDAGADPTDRDAVLDVLARTEVVLSTEPDRPQAVTVNGADVTEAIRRPDVDAAVSAVSAYEEVRAPMVARQRALAGDGAVVEGRDIGTVVFPDATLKVFLTADAAETRSRRAAERGSDEVSAAEAIRLRDARDSGRAHSPLRRAPDAIEVDNSVAGAQDAVVRKVLELLATRARERA